MIARALAERSLVKTMHGSAGSIVYFSALQAELR